MTITKIALSLLAGIGAGCTTVPPAPLVSMADLPNCFDANYDKELDLFTIKNAAGNVVNQQCLLTVGPRSDVASELLGGVWDAVTGLFTAGPRSNVASASRLTAGSYRVYLVNGGGGGAGGTLLEIAGRGGGGGGGAGAMETQATVDLTEGVYKLTIGAGGPGGSACLPHAGFGGGSGWAGSPSNMVRVATGEVVMGTPGADTYARPSRAQSERMAGKMDAHGGSGPGQTSGGHGASPDTVTKGGVTEVHLQAEPGASTIASGQLRAGGAAGFDPVDDKRSGAGGGGGATRVGPGGAGGGESPPQKRVAAENIAPERGSLGSGGGGGEGSTYKCDPGARGGHGYIALRLN